MSPEQFIDSREDLERILREENLGYLGLLHDGRPYVVPLNYAYAAGKIIFHCALEGQKIEAIRQDPRVCFTVGRQTGEVREHAGGNPCHVDSDSVVCYGRARLLEDLEERAAALNAFNRRFRPQAPDLAPSRVKDCLAVEITVSEMTGRQERARQRTYWRSLF
jgi:uncharacterized protein